MARNNTGRSTVLPRRLRELVGKVHRQQLRQPGLLGVRQRWLPLLVAVRWHWVLEQESALPWRDAVCKLHALPTYMQQFAPCGMRRLFQTVLCWLHLPP